MLRLWSNNTISTAVCGRRVVLMCVGRSMASTIRATTASRSTTSTSRCSLVSRRNTGPIASSNTSTTAMAATSA